MDRQIGVAWLFAITCIYVAGAVQDYCSEPFDAGLCRARFNVFAYDAVRGRCEVFVYGGCGGNSNNFDTLGRCQTDCEDGPSESARDVSATDRCNATIEKSNMGPIRYVFFLGKCIYTQVVPTSLNSFTTKEQCQSTCIKGQQDSTAAKCSAEIQPAEMGSYSYAFMGGKCVRLQVEPLSQNRFSSKFKCEMSCLTLGETRMAQPAASALQPQSSAAICSLPIESGRCSGIFSRFAFNSKTGTCEEFNYGGCGGNPNNFPYSGDCEATCLSTESRDPNGENRCAAPVKKSKYGVKRAIFSGGRCFYPVAIQSESINNFASLQECIDECDTPEPRPAPAHDSKCSGSYVKSNSGVTRAVFADGICLFPVRITPTSTNNFESHEECNRLCSIPVQSPNSRSAGVDLDELAKLLGVESLVPSEFT